MNATHHILFTAPVPRSQVTVCARAKYGRKEASRGLEEAAGAVWEARLQVPSKCLVYSRERAFQNS